MPRSSQWPSCKDLISFKRLFALRNAVGENNSQAAFYERTRLKAVCEDCFSIGFLLFEKLFSFQRLNVATERTMVIHGFFYKVMEQRFKSVNVLYLNKPLNLPPLSLKVSFSYNLIKKMFVLMTHWKPLNVITEIFTWSNWPRLAKSEININKVL